MNARVAQWRNRCLKSSVFRTALRRRSSRVSEVTSFSSPSSSIRFGIVSMKESSVTLTRTFVLYFSVTAKATARERASFTRRPKQ